MTRWALSLGLCALLSAGCSRAEPPQPALASPFAPGALVDLSHTYDDTTVFWPTADRFRLDKVSDGMTEGGYYYAANNFFTSEHGGTHLDAPDVDGLLPLHHFSRVAFRSRDQRLLVWP